MKRGTITFSRDAHHSNSFINEVKKRYPSVQLKHDRSDKHDPEVGRLEIVLSEQDFERIQTSNYDFSTEVITRLARD